MKNLLVRCIFLSVLTFSTCRQPPCSGFIDQVNIVLLGGHSMDSLQGRTKTEQSFLAVIREVEEAKSSAMEHSSVIPEVEQVLWRADSLASALDCPALSIWTSTEIGFYYYRLAQLQKAFPYFLKSSQLIGTVKPANLITPASSLMKNAYFFGNIGDHMLSIEYLTDVIERYADTSDVAQINFAIGAEYAALEDYEQAEAYYLTAKAQAKDQDPICYAKVLGELAYLAMRSEDYVQAEILLKEDIRLSELHQADRNLMFARIRLASLYVEIQRWHEAKPITDHALAYIEGKANLAGFYEEVLQLQLSIAYALGDKETQLRLYPKLQEIRSLLKNTDGENAVMKVNLALQRSRAERDSLLQKAKLHQSQMRGLGLSLIGILLAVVAFFLFLRKRQQLHLQHVTFESTIARVQLDKMKSEKRYNEAQQTLQSYVIFLKERNKAIDELKREVDRLSKSTSWEASERKQELQQLLESHLMTDENWGRFKTTFINEYTVFYSKVNSRLPRLTESQLRIVFLQKLGLNNPDMANLLGVGQDSVKKAKQRLRKKYGEGYDQLFMEDERIRATNN